MKIKNVLYILLGILFMLLGMIGIVLPILPTTPFFILASIFFVKGSEKFDIWFRNTNIYKNYAEDFVKNRSMTLKRKIQVLLLADFMIAFPLIIIDNIYVRIFLIIVVIIKYYYFIFKIKTRPFNN